MMVPRPLFPMWEICRLIENDELRNDIALRGNEYIQQFDIEKSYDKFKHILQRQAD